MKDYRELFGSLFDELARVRKSARELLRRDPNSLQAPTRHPGSKRLPFLVKAERRRQGKAAKQARKLNRRGKSRPKGRRTK